MRSAHSLNILLIAEGSGGHLIPALEVASALAKSGARIKVWYAQRQPIAGLARALVAEHLPDSVDVDPIPVPRRGGPISRLRQCGELWQRAQRCFDTFSPDVVVGFGGWISAPVLLAACLRPATNLWRGKQARRHRIRCLVHEQNVIPGRANRLLAHWVDRVAVSFQETQGMVNGTPSVMTGLPVRETIGQLSRADAARYFGLQPDWPTLLVLGGSQGARAINRLMMELAELLCVAETETWQVVHLTGPSDEAAVRTAYARAQIRAWVAPFLVQMQAAYALADVAVARAGASTMAELARCGLPAILIPYPHAGGHQRANAQLVEAVGAGVVLEESAASAERLLGSIRQLMTDERLRDMMGSQMRALHRGGAANRLAEAIVELGTGRRACAQGAGA